jgi:hypothetical protein
LPDAVVVRADVVVDESGRHLNGAAGAKAGAGGGTK